MKVKTLTKWLEWGTGADFIPAQHMIKCWYLTLHRFPCPHKWGVGWQNTSHPILQNTDVPNNAIKLLDCCVNPGCSEVWKLARIRSSWLYYVRLDERENKLLSLKTASIRPYKGINRYSNQLNLRPCHISALKFYTLKHKSIQNII